MKKFIALFIILSFLFVVSGCEAFRRNNDLNNNELNGDTTNGDFMDGNSPGTIQDPDTNEIPQGAPLGTTSELPYATSVRDLDGTLRRSINDLDRVKIDRNGDDYLVRQGEYYQKRADAYKKALDGINNVSYTGNNRNDHNALISYYQNGYDTYNSLATKYRGFKTIDDERAYRTGEGRNAYDLMPEINDAYNRSLNSLGIKY